MTTIIRSARCPYPGLEEQALPLVVVGARVHRTAGRGGKQPAAAHPKLSGITALTFLRSLVLAQQLNQLGGQPDTARPARDFVSSVSSRSGSRSDNARRTYNRRSRRTRAATSAATGRAAPTSSPRPGPHPTTTTVFSRTNGAAMFSTQCVNHFSTVQDCLTGQGVGKGGVKVKLTVEAE